MKGIRFGSEKWFLIVTLNPIFILMTIQLFSKSVEPFSWSNCDTDDPIMIFNSIEFTDEPIVIGDPDNPFQMSIEANLNRSINDKMMAKMEISKGFTIFGKRFTLPAFPCINGYGSCEQNFCNYLTDPENAFGCSFLASLGRPCSCPLDPGLLFTDQFEGHIDLSNVPSMILWLSSGDYNVKLMLTEDGKKLACIDLDLSLEMVKVSNQEQDSDKF